MATAKYFSQCPEFPDDVPLAETATVSLERLKCSDEAESNKLYQACREQGFFFLELESTAHGRVLLEDAKAMFDLTNELFDMDREILDCYEYKPPKSFLGYKASGTVKTEEGQLDIMEMFNIGRDDVLDKSATPESLPHVIQSRRKQCQNFCLHANEAICTILDCLNKSLDLPTGTLRSLSALDKPSASSIRLIRACASALKEDQRVTLGGHTDIGLVSMLFNVVGGLQILPFESENTYENWQYVRPQPGCAFVNLGDTMVEFTGEVLRSSLHRVHNAPGKQAQVVRQSLAYFVKSPSELKMTRLQGGSVIAPLSDGERDTEAMSVDEWALWRSREIFEGRLLPKTRGGVPNKTDWRAHMAATPVGT